MVFIIMYMFVEALQAESAWCSLSAALVYSTESWFLPGWSSTFHYIPMQCVVPQSCRSTQMLWTKS